MTEPCRVRSLREIEAEILDGDMLAFRGHGLASRAITVGGRTHYSHIGGAAWWLTERGERDLFCAEVREWVGARAVPLAKLVQRWPMRIDVYRPDPQGWWGFDRGGAARIMRLLAGEPYGWIALAAAAALHAPLLRWLVKPDLDDLFTSRLPPFCSHAYAMACRIGGKVDPVRHLADRLTEPGDLARSVFFDYLFTLVN